MVLGPRPKQISMVLQSASEGETEDPAILESSLEDAGSFGVMDNLFSHISTKLWAVKR